MQSPKINFIVWCKCVQTVNCKNYELKCFVIFQNHLFYYLPAQRAMMTADMQDESEQVRNLHERHV